MTTALIYLVVMVLVAAVVYLLVSTVFGRGEELAPLPPGASPTRLPADEATGDDIRSVRFQQVFRGYKMSEVDWVLARLSTEVDQLRGRLAELEPAAVGARSGQPPGVPQVGGGTGDAPTRRSFANHDPANHDTGEYDPGHPSASNQAAPSQSPPNHPNAALGTDTPTAAAPDADLPGVDPHGVDKYGSDPHGRDQRRADPNRDGSHRGDSHGGDAHRAGADNVSPDAGAEGRPRTQPGD